MPFHLPPEGARGAYFHVRDIFSHVKYFFRLDLTLAMEVYNKLLFIDSLGFMAVDTIKKHLLGLNQSNILIFALILWFRAE